MRFKHCVAATIAMFLCFVFATATNANIGTETEKIIVLTFDDGPKPYVLKELLPLLKTSNVPGTFFVVGWRIPQNKELIKKIREAGHEIENHSWGHENAIEWFKKKGAEGIKTSLAKTDKAISEITGTRTRFFRPRSWAINEEVEKIVTSLGYTIMKQTEQGGLDINTMDYMDFEKRHPPKILIKRVEKIIANMENQKKFRHILVFHELPITVKALEIIIPRLKNRGYKFIRLNEYF